MPDKLTYLYADTFKADPETGQFEGIVNTGKVDVTGQIVDPDWLKKELPPWITDWANIRHQHDPMKPIGVAEEADLTFKAGPKISGRVVDDQGIRNLRAGLYKGLSVGIKAPVIVKDAQAPAGRIVGGKLIEISLVDRPADDGAKLLLYKSVGADEWKDCQTGAVLSPRESDLAEHAAPGSPLANLKAAQADTTVEKAADADVTKREFSDKERKQLAKEGKAMADGSYPIVTVGDLENAVRAYGRSPDEATKRHIIKRAKALGRTDLLPADWPGSTKKENKMTDTATTPVAADAEKARAPKSEPSHAHPFRGSHNHAHPDGRGGTHTHLHLHDDDDIHDHPHLMGKDARVLSPEERQQAMSLYAAEADLHKAAPTHPFDGTHTHDHAHDGKSHSHDHAHDNDSDHDHDHSAAQTDALKTAKPDSAKAAPDWNIENPAPRTIGRPGAIQDNLPGDFKDALRRIEALSGQTDDRDGDVDTDANMEDDAMQKREASDFQGDNPRPSLIDPSKLELMFAAALEKTAAAIEKRLDARLAALQSQYVTKTAAAENLSTAADVAKMASDLAKGLSVLADRAKASGEELASVRAELAETKADLEKVKELAQPPKGVVAVTKGIGIEPDTFVDAINGKQTDTVSEYIAKALSLDDNERRDAAAAIAKALYGKGNNR